VADTTGVDRADNLNKLAKGAVNIYEKWKKTNDTLQYNTVKANISEGMLSLQARALQDPDYNAGEAYLKEADKIREEALKDMSPGSAKDLATIQFDHETNVAKIKLDSIFRSKQVEFGILQYDRNVAILKEKAYSSPGEEAAISREMDILLAAQVDGGILSLAQAGKEKDNFLKEVGIGVVNRDIFNDSEKAYVELKKGKKGKYAYLDQDDRISLINTAKGTVDANEAYKKYVKNKEIIAKRFDIATRIAKGELAPSGYQEEINDVIDVDYRMAEALRKNLGNGQFVVEDETNQPFIDVLTETFKSATDKEVTDVITNVLDNPKISRDRFAGLIWACKKRAEEIDNPNKGNWWTNTFRWLTATDKMEVLVNTITRAEKENAADDRSAQILKEEIQKDRKNNVVDITTFGEKGQIMMDAEGNRAIVYPDGRIEEIE